MTSATTDDWRNPIPAWFVPGGGKVLPTQTKTEEAKPVTPPGPKWYVPLFQRLRSSGDRLRWINDEAWILPGSDSQLEWYRTHIGPVELATAAYFDKRDELRSKIIAAYHEKVQRLSATRGIDESHRLARDCFTIRGGDWNGDRDWEEIDRTCRDWK